MIFMNATDYQWYKSHGICVYCKTENADEGFATCLACRMDNRARIDKRSEEAKERHKKWLKRRRDLNYAFGVCIVCGAKDAKKGSHLCPYCLSKIKQRSENYRRQKGILPRNSYTKTGICYFCNEPAVEGKKTCTKHYEILKERMRKARAAKTEKNYFEKANQSFWCK